MLISDRSKVINAVIYRSASMTQRMIRARMKQTHGAAQSYKRHVLRLVRADTSRISVAGVILATNGLEKLRQLIHTVQFMQQYFDRAITRCCLIVH